MEIKNLILKKNYNKSFKINQINKVYKQISTFNKKVNKLKNII